MHVDHPLKLISTNVQVNSECQATVFSPNCYFCCLCTFYTSLGAEYSMLPCPPGGDDFPGHDDGPDDMGPVGGPEVRN